MTLESLPESESEGGAKTNNATHARTHARGHWFACASGASGGPVGETWRGEGGGKLTGSIRASSRAEGVLYRASHADGDACSGGADSRWRKKDWMKAVTYSCDIGSLFDGLSFDVDIGDAFNNGKRVEFSTSTR